MNAWEIVRAFEQAVAEYTGAPYAVAMDSCTNALFLALRWCRRTIAPSVLRINWSAPDQVGIPTVFCPRRTYVSVPMQALHAGFSVQFRDETWKGAYRLEPLPVWDAAKRFRAGMFWETAGEGADGQSTGPAFVCVSFHPWKILSVGPGGGGAVLTDDPEAAAWMRRARYDGRTPGVPVSEDAISEIGWHCPMYPAEAALGLYKLQGLPRWNEDQPTDPDYPDCAALPCFRS